MVEITIPEEYTELTTELIKKVFELICLYLVYVFLTDNVLLVYASGSIISLLAYHLILKYILI